MPALGRLYVPDPRDEKFPLTALLPAARPKLKLKTWRIGPILDQGPALSCVGQGWRNWMSAAPVEDRADGPPAAGDIYAAAQKLDGMALPHDGSTVRAGAKVMQAQGRIKSYHWSTNVQDTADYLLGQGPVVIGVNWTQAMFTPDNSNVIRYQGPPVGGHCVLLFAVDAVRALVRLYNSWGAAWADKGRAYLPFEDLDRLLKDQGEACAALEQKVA